MADQAKNILIGIFVIAACAIVIFVLLFLHPTVGDQGQIVHVRFADIDKVNLGTRVTYGGKPVGEVIAINQIQEPPSKVREGVNGFVYLYELDLRVDSHVKIYNTDEILLRTSGLLGERSIEITPHPLKKDEKLELVNKKILYANESGSVEETLRELKDLADKFERALTPIETLATDLNEKKVMEKINQTMIHLRNITDALDNPKQWTETLANLHTFSQNAIKSWEKVDGSIEKLDRSLNNLQLVTSEIQGGRGTVGKIVMNDDLYLRLTSILSKGETLFDDINHYGLLFQTDKGWQRLRARRANLLYKLSSPQEFRNYFNDELDQITTSLSRISVVLDEAECCDQYEDFMEDTEFRKVFAELIRRVKVMEESLKIYNQQLVDRDVRQTELICY